MSKKLSFAALLLQNRVYITHALHFRCNLAAIVKSALTQIINISEANLQILNLAKSVSKMTEDNEDDEELQLFMSLTAVGVVVAIELAKCLMEIPKDELSADVIQATVEEHKMMQDEMDAEIEDEIDDGMDDKVEEENNENEYPPIFRPVCSKGNRKQK